MRAKTIHWMHPVYIVYSLTKSKIPIDLSESYFSKAIDHLMGQRLNQDDVVIILCYDESSLVTVFKCDCSYKWYVSAISLLDQSEIITFSIFVPPL